MRLAAVRNTAPGARRGSVLIPAVAAMLLLVVCGQALVEALSARRYESAFETETSRARWTAEAGLWHAIAANRSLPSPVTFAGGSYTVAKSNRVFRSTGTFGDSTYELALDLNDVIGPEPMEVVVEGPIDIAAAVASVEKVSQSRFEMDLVSLHDMALQIYTIQLGGDNPDQELYQAFLNGATIWQYLGGQPIPTGAMPLIWWGTSSAWIQPGDTGRFGMSMWGWPDGDTSYELTITFTDGQSATIKFEVDW